MKRNFTPQRNTQQQLVEFLINNPFTTEKNICIECWDEIRDKKHADLIRRALGSGKISRVRAKIKNKTAYRFDATRGVKGNKEKLIALLQSDDMAYLRFKKYIPFKYKNNGV